MVPNAQVNARTRRRRGRPVEPLVGPRESETTGAAAGTGKEIERAEQPPEEDAQLEQRGQQAQACLASKIDLRR